MSGNQLRDYINQVVPDLTKTSGMVCDPEFVKYMWIAVADTFDTDDIKSDQDLRFTVKYDGDFYVEIFKPTVVGGNVDLYVYPETVSQVVYQCCVANATITAERWDNFLQQLRPEDEE